MNMKGSVFSTEKQKDVILHKTDHGGRIHDYEIFKNIDENYKQNLCGKILTPRTYAIGILFLVTQHFIEEGHSLLIERIQTLSRTLSPYQECRLIPYGHIITLVKIAHGTF